nr:MAG TPA: hypothetical protein [Caudoviricetes sp.]
MFYSFFYLRFFEVLCSRLISSFFSISSFYSCIRRISRDDVLVYKSLLL